jgi:hypothetical protein
MPRIRMRKGRYSCPQQLLSRQIRAPGREVPVPIGQEAGWAPEPDKILSLPSLELHPAPSSHYTDRATGQLGRLTLTCYENHREPFSLREHVRFLKSLQAVFMVRGLLYRARTQTLLHPPNENKGTACQGSDPLTQGRQCL